MAKPTKILPDMLPTLTVRERMLLFAVE